MTVFLSRSKTKASIFLRWNLLFSHLSTWPFTGGVTVIVAWLLILRSFLHPLHSLLDHALGVNVIPLNMPPPSNDYSFSSIIDLLVLAPLFETWFFLKITFCIAEKLFDISIFPWRIIFLSGGLFGLSHCFSVGYIVYTFFGGCMLASAYYFGGRSRRTFWMIVLAHMSFNLICVGLAFIPTIC